eukprot:gnl/TRDRNA2_/TRDRNA2_57033_c0_seq1.p1 gnl/TRDRNA2_/TRDRNA2_57033_c0~~gnl/TRDRNA2_/TRDRNA2_57033_c0_seq1.p1  ORF type:complete len:317 (-),score=69.63 gnl/TRDRNA2_/TRDRNA2_57033_c0_seq1:232-1182(-)
MLENGAPSDGESDDFIEPSQNKRRRTVSLGVASVPAVVTSPAALQVKFEDSLSMALAVADHKAGAAHDEICRQEEAMQAESQEPLQTSIMEFARLHRPSSVDEQRERRRARGSLHSRVDQTLAAMDVMLENLQIPDQSAAAAELQQLQEIDAATEDHHKCLAVLEAARQRVTMEVSRRHENNLSQTEHVVSKLAPISQALYDFAQQDLETVREEVKKKKLILQPRLQRDQNFIDSCIDADIAPTQDDEYVRARKSLQKTQEDLQSAELAMDAARGRKNKAAEMSSKLEQAELALKQQKQKSARHFWTRFCKGRALC